MYCDLWSGIWGFVSTERGAREAGRGNSSRMCTVTAVWMTGLWKAQPKGYSRGQSSFGSLCTTTFARLRQPYPLKPKERAIQTTLSTWGNSYFISHNIHTNTSHSWFIMAYPLMISLHSARMKCSLSGVRMHSEFFWPVLDSPSMTSEHWFILIVPWGKVVGWGTQHRHTKC